MKIHVQSPTRVDLAGGTLDMWPLSAFVGDAVTINIAISLWTECELEAHQGIEIVSEDLKKTWTFADRRALMASPDGQLAFYQGLFASFPALDQIRLVTRSQSPVGGGIGGSSSLLISCMKAVHQHLGQSLPTPVELTLWAHQIEARMLRTPTGTQDYLPAVTGGLSVIRYQDRAMSQEIRSMRGTPFETHFLLVNTGRSHHSGLNNFDVLSRAVHRDETVFQALMKIRDVSSRMEKVLAAGEWDKLPSLFHEELEARLMLTPKFSSPEIERLHDLSQRAGALAMKICGAGGGGCVMIWVDPQHREKVIETCQSAGFQVLNAKPVDPLPKSGAMA